MSFLIASDIHGSAYWCERLAAKAAELDPEGLILLGDILYHGPRNDLPKDYSPKRVAEMLNPLADRLICVRGNCDSEVDQMMLDFPVMSDSAYICAYGQRVFATHGHIFSPDKPPKLADGDILLYGHTHITRDEQITAGGKTIRCINPGSVSIPKGGSANRCILWNDGEFTELLL